MVNEKSINKIIILSRKNISNSNNKNIINLKVDITKDQDIIYLKNYLIENKLNINGVFQLAGILGDSFFHETSFKEFKRIIEPKIKGTDNIITLFKQSDFIILFYLYFQYLVMQNLVIIVLGMVI